MKRGFILALACCICVLSMSSFAAVIHVPADQPTIQAGIDAAVDFDTVLVAPGTYTGAGNHDIDFGGKSIVVESSDGAAATIVDCQGSPVQLQRGFRFHSGETYDAVLDGFTITHGYAPGDVNVDNWPQGGGICCDNSSPTIVNCVFVANHAGDGGGGVSAALGAHPIITNCVFRSNSAVYAGGLYSCWSASPTVSHCSFFGNSAIRDGGGANCTYRSTPAFDHCVFANNHADVGGGMMFYDSSDVTLASCTFYGNSAFYGSGINCNGSVLIVENSIIANGIEGSGFNCAYFGTVSLSCTDVYGNQGGDWVGCLAGQEGSQGNLSVEPAFCNPVLEDFQIITTSPCAPANNSCGVLIGALDVTSDCQQPSTHVWHINAQGTGDAPTIQAAITLATDGDSILVEPGSYFENLVIQSKGLTIMGVTEADQTLILPLLNTAPTVKYISTTDKENTLQSFTFSGSQALAAVQSWFGGYLHIRANRFVGNNTQWGALSIDGECMVEDNYFANNVGSGHGGAFHLTSHVASVVRANTFFYNSSQFGGAFDAHQAYNALITRNLFVGNQSTEYGGAIYLGEAENTRVVNNTIDSCTSLDNSGGAVSLLVSQNCACVNNIITNCQGFGIWESQSAGDTIWYNDAYENLPADFSGAVPGNGSLSEDPKFVGGNPFSYHLQAGSPCINAGNPDPIYDDPNGTRNDMGAYPIAGSSGDADGDGTVTISDIIFIIHYIFLDGPAPQPLTLGDANCDGSINITDAVYLVNYIFAGGASPCSGN